ncbi:MAG: vacuolar protein sorting-associated protein 35 [Benjaminiella poitrasii]|nr:MAG: vacuolar protein sorting-associated protein 35 [Benjaminiella poitrasii]
MMNDSSESQHLKESLSSVHIQSKLMKKHLDKNRLMDGIKHCSNMLSELRTSSLSPKYYYELYMTIFDAMRYLTSYLLDAHQSEKYHLGDLYEIVQYASSIIPRLYLMITVGSVYLSVKDAPPVSEVLDDMIEMVKGVQHPVRALFLRHYLGGMVRDFLANNGEHLEAVIPFLLTNFAEMNKLWVRLQYLGHTRDRPRREIERKEVGTLVGTNLVRLSQLEGVDLKVYQRDILPGILSQVVYCHDVMAQEYLMDVIIQIFPDEFHVHTLKPFLATTAQLHSMVNIKGIIMALLDRLATSTADEESPKSTENEKLFTMFWNEIMELINKRQDFPIEDITSLFLSLANFSVSTYPKRLDYIDQILSFTKDFIITTQQTGSDSNQMLVLQQSTKQSVSNILQLLLLPTKTWDILTLITTLRHYQPLLAIQPYPTRRTVALTILNHLLQKDTCIDQPEQVYQILEICHVLVRNEKENKDYGGDFVTKQLLSPYYHDHHSDDDNRDEQGWVARLVHLFYSENEDVQFLLLSAARQQLEKGDKSMIKTVFPSLISSSLKLAKRYYTKKPFILKKEEDDTKPEQHDDEQSTLENDTIAIQEEWTKKMTTLFHFIYQIIMTYYRQWLYTESQTVQFLLMAGQSANYCGFEQIAYNFYLDAFRVYEEGVSHSRAQFDTIVYSIGSLLSSQFDKHSSNYSTLSTKIALYSTKLLKKPDQSRAVYICSHLWQHDDSSSRLIECLQKSLKIADSCIDTATNELLFVELLNQYMYYFERNHPLVQVDYLNGLIDLISSRMNYLLQEKEEEYPIMTSSSSFLLDYPQNEIIDYITRQFQQTLNHFKLYHQQPTQE